MKAAIGVVAAILAGLVLGTLTMGALTAPVPIDDTAGTAARDRVPGPGTDAAEHPADQGSAPTGLPTSPVEPPPGGDGDGLLLVWAAGGLPDEFEGRVAALPGVEDTTTVAGDLVDLVATATADGAPVDTFDDGWTVPLDLLAVDPHGYAAFLPTADAGDLAGLAPGQVVLGATSADLRDLGVGDAVTLAGGLELIVHAVVDDTLVGGAEAVVHLADAADAGVDTDRFVLLTHTGTRAELEPSIRRLTDVEVRVRAPGETPYLRHGDAVLPQARIKARFGEFSYRRPGGGIRFEQDRAWIEEQLVTTTVPVLGQVRCHRGIVRQLAGAMQELTDAGLDHLVDPDQYAGCHEPRLISPHAGVSRHAWGIAVDLNAIDNPHGQPPEQDPRLVETMARWGFTWGGFWLVPDAMHFEYIGPPDPGTAAPSP